MLLHALNQDQKVQFLRIATLFSLIDQPAIDWNEVPENEYPDDVVGDFRSILEGEKQGAILDMFLRECGEDTSRSLMYVGIGENPDYNYMDVEKEILDRMSSFTTNIRRMPAVRREVANSILAKYLKANAAPRMNDENLKLPHAPKVMLFELIWLCLSGGKMSDIQAGMLEALAREAHIDTDTFDEILERATSFLDTSNKTLEFILE